VYSGSVTAGTEALSSPPSLADWNSNGWTLSIIVKMPADLGSFTSSTSNLGHSATCGAPYVVWNSNGLGFGIQCNPSTSFSFSIASPFFIPMSSFAAAQSYLLTITRTGGSADRRITIRAFDNSGALVDQATGFFDGSDFLVAPNIAGGAWAGSEIFPGTTFCIDFELECNMFSGQTTPGSTSPLSYSPTLADWASSYTLSFRFTMPADLNSITGSQVSVGRM